MTPEKLRVGVIGANPNYGWAGRAHFPALAHLPEYEVAALCTSNPASAEAAARHYGVANAYHDYTEMVQRPDLDVVSVSVRAPSHHAMVMAALNAGKHVFCEWPLGVTLAEAEEMAETAQAQNVRHMVGLQAQCDPVLLRLKQLISEGYVGRVLSVTMTLFVSGTIHLESKNAWEADVRNGAHALSIGGGHTLDALAFCVADFSEIACQVTTELSTRRVADTGDSVTVTSPDHIFIAGKLANDAAVSATVAYVPWHGGGWKMDVYGTEGTLVADSASYPQIVEPRLRGGQMGQDALAEIAIPSGLTWVPEGVPRGPGFNVAQMYRRLAEAIRGCETAQPDFHRAVRIHSLLDAINESSATGRRVAVG